MPEPNDALPASAPAVTAPVRTLRRTAPDVRSGAALWPPGAGPSTAPATEGPAQDPQSDPKLRIDQCALSLDALFDLWETRQRRQLRPSASLQHHASISQGDAQALLAADPSRLALLTTPSGRILGASAAAVERLTERTGAAVDQLPFDAADSAKLLLAMARVTQGPSGLRVTLRARSIQSGKLLLLQVSVAPRASGQPMLCVIQGVDLDWPEPVRATIAALFGLDPRQEELLRGLALGESLTELAASHGLAEAELTGQIATLLSKNGLLSLREMLQVALNLMDSAEPSAGGPAPAQSGREREARRLAKAGLHPDDSHRMMADGRCLEWLEYGAPGGRPLLYMHYAYGMTRWSDRAIRAARQRGLRIIVPLRAGYGASSPKPDHLDWRTSVINDYARVCDHLGLQSPVVVTQGSDLRYALALAEARPDLVGAALGCAVQLPLATHAHFERMGKWQRFALRNARFAPEVLSSVLSAALSMLDRFGVEALLRIFNESSPADLAALDLPEVREALVAGIGHALPTDEAQGIALLVGECIDAETDWLPLLQRTRVPVRLLQASEDPLSPLPDLAALAADYPHVDFRLMEGTGQFLIYQRWPELLDAVEELSGAIPPGSGDGAPPDRGAE